MIIVNKLYRKDFNQYNIEDWKYIFSIYKMRDKYNFTEEEFLVAELVDKIDMMKKMDESLYTGGTITIDEQNKPLVDSCSENSCEAINNFLDNKETEDGLIITDVEIKKFLDGDKDNSFNKFYHSIQIVFHEIQTCQNRIEEYKKKIRAEIDDIQVYRQKIDEAFNQYIE